MAMIQNHVLRDWRWVKSKDNAQLFKRGQVEKLVFLIYTLLYPFSFSLPPFFHPSGELPLFFDFKDLSLSLFPLPSRLFHLLFQVKFEVKSTLEKWKSFCLENR
jgi:hypothetical protein